MAESSLCNSVRNNEEENPPRGPFRGSAESGNRTFFCLLSTRRSVVKDSLFDGANNRRLS